MNAIAISANADVQIDFNQFIQAEKNQPVTTSVLVAQAFKKRHKDVLRKIDELLTQMPASFEERNFAPLETEYKNNLGHTVKTRAFQLTKDGFILLVMGFTGKAAMKIKIAYIEAFNHMATLLAKPARAYSLSEERSGLRRAVTMTAEKLGIDEIRVYRMVNQYMNSGSIRYIPVNRLPEAVAYCHRLTMAGKPKSNTKNKKQSIPQPPNEGVLVPLDLAKMLLKYHQQASAFGKECLLKYREFVTEAGFEFGDCYSRSPLAKSSYLVAAEYALYLGAFQRLVEKVKA